MRYFSISRAAGVLLRYPRLLILAAAVSGLLYAYEVIIARPAMVYMGIPVSLDNSPLHWTRILRNDAYMSGYSELRGNPLWVVYRLTPLPKNSGRHKRPRHFSPDWRSITHIASSDYTRSGYDRGHMAPNHAISRLYGKAAQEETFLMTNITPQKPSLNQKVWQRLEERESTRYLKHFRELWVYTGPVFDSKVSRLKSAWRIEIPDAFYKIYAGIDVRGRPHLLAYLIPQDVRGDEKLEQFMTTVDTIEKRVGFDFFHELEDRLEILLESKLSGGEWQ